MASSDSGAGSEEEEEAWPPWLERVVAADAEFYDDVEVLEEGGSKEKRPGLVAVKAIRMPEPVHAAAGKGPGQCPMALIQKYSTVLIAAGPLEPPYIGLVEQIWRKADAGKDVGGRRVYKPSDFGVECYWFYRPQEVPATAWQDMPGREPVPGITRARYPIKKARTFTERHSERHVLFSSHHTRHDYPDAQADSPWGRGVLAFEGFLQRCKVHWPRPSDPPPRRYAIHAGKLVSTPAPGFVVDGFLWCNAKSKAMFDDAFKRVHPTTATWGDAATQGIPAKMQERYARGTAVQLASANEAIIERYASAAQRGKGGVGGAAAVAAAAAALPSDDGFADSGSAEDEGGGGGSGAAEAARSSAAAAAAAAAARGGGGSSRDAGAGAVAAAAWAE